MTSPTSDIVARALQIASAADGSTAAAKDALRECAALISSLVVERDAAQTSHAAARQNFLTMQGAAAELKDRALTAERLLAEAREALREMGSSRVRDRVAAKVGCNHDLLHDALQAEVRALSIGGGNGQ